jgi:hypothetical protein
MVPVLKGRQNKPTSANGIFFILNEIRQLSISGSLACVEFQAESLPIKMYVKAFIKTIKSL